MSLYHDALDLTRETRQPDDEAYALEGIGLCHLRTGDHGGRRMPERRAGRLRAP
jgi:hypothetical protein